MSVTDADTLWPEVGKIAKRENVSVSAVVVRAIREFVAEHRKGNYQHYMTSFMDGGEKSNRQLEQAIVDRFLERHEVNYREVQDAVRGVGYEGKKRVDAANRVIQQIRERGVKIWR